MNCSWLKSFAFVLSCLPVFIEVMGNKSNFIKRFIPLKSNKHSYANIFQSPKKITPSFFYDGREHASYHLSEIKAFQSSTLSKPFFNKHLSQTFYAPYAFSIKDSIFSIGKGLGCGYACYQSIAPQALAKKETNFFGIQSAPNHSVANNSSSLLAQQGAFFYPQKIEKTAMQAALVGECQLSNTQIIQNLEFFCSESERVIQELKIMYDKSRIALPDLTKKMLTMKYEHILFIEMLILEGKLVNWKGLHHDFNYFLENSGLLTVFNKKVLPNGVYSAMVSVCGFAPKYKTFFPAHWPPEKVVSAVFEAYENFLKDPKKYKLTKTGNYRVVAMTSENMKIEMIIEKYGKIIKTAYPFVEIK